MSVNHRELAENYIRTATSRRGSDPEQAASLQLTAIYEMLLSVDDHLARLAERLTHGPVASHTHGSTVPRRFPDLGDVGGDGL